jgi:hypothetical protein
MLGIFCSHNKWGWKCPPCESRCEPHCSYTDRAAFLEALRVYRDTQCENIRAPILFFESAAVVNCYFPAAGDERHQFLAQFYKDCQGAFALFDRRMERNDRVEVGHRLIIDSLDFDTVRGFLDWAYSTQIPVRVRSMIGERLLCLLRIGPEAGVAPLSTSSY